MSFSNPCQNERGVALIIALMFLSILGLLGTTALVLTTTDIRIGGNYKTNAQAFYDADAGVNYAIAGMAEGLKADPQTFILPATIGSSSSLTPFSAPTGFGFSYKAPGITMITENRFSFITNGSGPNNAQSTIKAICKRSPMINYAAFGNQKLDIKNGVLTQSYDSSSSVSAERNPNDPSFQSTHKADVCSNDWLLTQNGVSIDGSGVLGEKQDGSPTTNGISSGTTFYGDTPVNKGRIDPDPLGSMSGGEYDPTTYSTSNDNSLATGLSGNTINGNALLIGTPGGADYFLTSITLGNSEKLTVDTSAGDVRIFLTGPIDLRDNSEIEMNPATCDATKFAVFSNSVSKISIENSADFIGLIYAPYAPVDVKNSAEVYGAIWGNNVEINNSGAIYYDSALRNKYLSNNLSLTAWEDLR